MKNFLRPALILGGICVVLTLGFSFIGDTTGVHIIRFPLVLLSLLAVGTSWSFLLYTRFDFLAFTVTTLIFALCLPVISTYALVRMGIPYSSHSISVTLTMLYLLPVAILIFRKVLNQKKSNV